MGGVTKHLAITYSYVIVVGRVVGLVGNAANLAWDRLGGLVV